MVSAGKFATFLFPEGEYDAPGPVFRGALRNTDLVNDVREPLDSIVTTQLKHFCCDVADARSFVMSLDRACATSALVT